VAGSYTIYHILRQKKKVQHSAVVDLKNQIKWQNDWLKLLVLNMIDHRSYMHNVSSYEIKA